jgi:glycosyltransferase involved in cell wall biosynthesis
MNSNEQKSLKAKITYVYTGRLEYRGRLLKQISTLQEAGHDCRLMYGAWGETPLQKEDFNFPIEVIPTPRKFGALALFFNQLKFGYMAGHRIADSDATHAVCFSLESLLAGAVAKRRKPELKLIFDSNELHIESFVSRNKRNLWAPIQKFCIRYCDLIMHAETNRIEYFKKHHDPTDRPQFLLENFPFFTPKRNLSEAPPVPPIRVLYVGMLGFDRYTRELIDIFRELAPDFSLDLVGPMEPKLRAEIDRVFRDNPAANVKFLPAIPYGGMSDLISNYHVGIALYKNNNINNYYCAPNKVYDYLMNGVPVVANDYPGLMKVLEGGKVGACVAEVDLKNFRSALELICSERRWENITDEVRNRYSWEAQIPGFLAHFR